jgi:hypothetical protein
VRSGFAKAAEEQSNLGREVKAHIAGSAQQASDLARMRSILDSAEVRIATIENRLAIILRLLWSVVFLLAVTIVIIAIHACR